MPNTDFQNGVVLGSVAGGNIQTSAPSGNIDISENGEYDVTAYATATVDVAGGGGIQDGYIVTFKVDGDDYYIASCEAGGTITEPPTPTKTGWFFSTWQLNGVDITFPYTPSADAELTAYFVSYQPLEYIQTTSSDLQYIDTGYVPNQNTKIEAEYEYTAIKSWQTPFGIRISNTHNLYIWINSGGTGYFGWGNTDAYAYYGFISANNHYRTIMSAGKVEHGLYNGTLGTTNFNAGTIDTDKTVTIFGANNGTTISTGECSNNMRLYSFKIYENDNLMFSFVPAKVNNVACLVDELTGNPYYNLGAGNFITPN